MARHAYDSRAGAADFLMQNARLQGKLSDADQEELRGLPFRLHQVESDEDIVRQGDHPDVAVLVLEGMVARYHTLDTGDRQYLSFHIAGDMPDAQSLFLKVMDHSVCSLDRGVIALFPHDDVLRVLRHRPSVCFALWRMTLADAAIFRQAITNRSRSHTARLAHLVCEIFFRSKENGLADENRCRFPVTQNQIGQALGMSHISVNRTLQKLRRSHLVEFRNGMLTVLDWPGLVRVASFDPLYLHVV